MADGLAMAANAVLERTIVVPFKEGVETNDCARSTILIWIVLLMQVPDTAALMHLNLYCLPHEAPLSHIPSPAAANRFPDGNCDWSFPLHAVAALYARWRTRLLAIYHWQVNATLLFGYIYILIYTYVRMGAHTGRRCRRPRGSGGRILLLTGREIQVIGALTRWICLPCKNIIVPYMSLVYIMNWMLVI